MTKKKRNRQNKATGTRLAKYLGTVSSPPVPRGLLKLAPGLSPQQHPDFIRGAVMHEASSGGCGQATLTDIHREAFGAAYSVTCAHCGKEIRVDRVIYDEPHVHIFGDESTGPADPPDIVVYGLVLFKQVDLADAEAKVTTIIREAGVPGFPHRKEARLHCRELFGKDTRRETDWSEHSENFIFNVLEKLILALRSYRAFYAVGIADLATYPKEMPAPNGKDKIAVKKETLYPLAFQAAMIKLNEFGWLSADYKRTFYIDKQKTPVSIWGLPRKKVEEMLKFGTVIPEIAGDDKPILCDVADMLSYMPAEPSPRSKNLTPKDSGICTRCSTLRKRNLCISRHGQNPNTHSDTATFVATDSLTIESA